MENEEDINNIDGTEDVCIDSTLLFRYFLNDLK